MSNKIIFLLFLFVISKSYAQNIVNPNRDVWLRMGSQMEKIQENAHGVNQYYLFDFGSILLPSDSTIATANGFSIYYDERILRKKISKSLPINYYYLKLLETEGNSIAYYFFHTIIPNTEPKYLAHRCHMVEDRFNFVYEFKDGFWICTKKNP